MSFELSDDLELDARRLGVFEIERSKRRIAFKMARGRSAAFDRWAALIGFFAIYFAVLHLASAVVGWAVASLAGMVLVKRTSDRYAVEVALGRSRFPAIDEPLELLSTRATANKYVDDAGDPYRAPPVQQARFDSIVIDGREHSLDAVECLRLAKHDKVNVGYVVIEIRVREHGVARYQLTSFHEASGGRCAPAA